MKNKAKLILLLLLIVPCLFLFVACGDSKSYSSGLLYRLSGDERYYIVSGIGSCEDSNIVIPSTYKNKPVKEIKAKAFYECDYLKSVTIPNSVTGIGDNAFYGCSSLTSITLPENVTSIGISAFSACSSLQEITLPFVGGSETKNTYLGYIFGANSCSSNSDYVPKSLKKVTITKSIGEQAFYDCSNLTSITIGNNVTSIGDNAFSGCSGLTSITIPNNVTSIGRNAFRGCSSLQYNIYDNAKYLGNNENLYLVLIDAINKDIRTCTINSNTKFIYSDAFEQCTYLIRITIPNSVKSIGDYAFYNCMCLTKVYYKGTISDWNKILTGDFTAYYFTSDIIYYYSETKPNESGNYWHYDTDGITILEW